MSQIITNMTNIIFFFFGSLCRECFISLCHECLPHFAVSVLSDSLSLLRAVSFVLRVIMCGDRTGGFRVDSPREEFPFGKGCVPPSDAFALVAP